MQWFYVERYNHLRTNYFVMKDWCYFLIQKLSFHDMICHKNRNIISEKNCLKLIFQIINWMTFSKKELGSFSLWFASLWGLPLEALTFQVTCLDWNLSSFTLEIAPFQRKLQMFLVQSSCRLYLVHGSLKLLN